MNATEIRADITRTLEKVDERFLKVIQSMLTTYLEQEDKVIGYSIETGEPIYASQAEEEFKAILKEVEEGDYITLERGYRITS